MVIVYTIGGYGVSFVIPGGIYLKVASQYTIDIPIVLIIKISMCILYTSNISDLFLYC